MHDLEWKRFENLVDGYFCAKGMKTRPNSIALLLCGFCLGTLRTGGQALRVPKKGAPPSEIRPPQAEGASQGAAAVSVHRPGSRLRSAADGADVHEPTKCVTKRKRQSVRRSVGRSVGPPPYPQEIFS